MPNPIPISVIELAQEHLTLEEVRRWCGIISDYVDADQDALLTMLIPFARQAAADFTWRGILEQDWEYRLDAFPDSQDEGGKILLPKAPCISVTSIQYVNSEGTQTLVEGTDYRVSIESEPCAIEPISNWPATITQTGAVVITFTSGYKKNPASGTEERLRLPDAIKVGMLQLIKFVIDSGRESAVVSDGRSVDVKDLPFTTKVLWSSQSMREFV